eukprot:4085930-Alexandrium_andersonii.AAC.1
MTHHAECGRQEAGCKHRRMDDHSCACMLACASGGKQQDALEYDTRHLDKSQEGMASRNMGHWV